MRSTVRGIIGGTAQFQAQRYVSLTFLEVYPVAVDMTNTDFLHSFRLKKEDSRPM